MLLCCCYSVADGGALNDILIMHNCSAFTHNNIILLVKMRDNSEWAKGYNTSCINLKWDMLPLSCLWYRLQLSVQNQMTLLYWSFNTTNRSSPGYERVYLPLGKVTDTPFHIQGDEVSRTTLSYKVKRQYRVTTYFKNKPLLPFGLAHSSTRAWFYINNVLLSYINQSSFPWHNCSCIIIFIIIYILCTQSPNTWYAINIKSIVKQC